MLRCHTENQAIQASTRATLRTEARILRANKMLENFADTATLLIWEENTQELTIHSDLIEAKFWFFVSTVCELKLFAEKAPTGHSVARGA